MPLRSLLKALLALLSVGSFCLAAEPAASNSSTRIVFIGDSITGQGGGWRGAGYVFKMREALSAVYPEGTHDLVPLGGSGMGVDAWLSVLKDEAKQKQDLDVKGVQIDTALSQPADRLVVMLGMNDVLAPYVRGDTDDGLAKWEAKYRELIGLLRTQLRPKFIALATITPQTEDPETPMNRVLARMNQRIEALATELKASVLPTNAMYWKVLAQARKTQADFTLARDRIHPQQTGHIVVAMAMLKGLGEEKAAAWLREERLAVALANLPTTAAPPAPPPWLVTSGLILRPWQGQPVDADLAPNPIDLAIERGEDFTQTSAKEGGAPLKWRTFQSSINLTDGANPGSVDYAGITYALAFEAGYGARWIHSATARRLKLDLKSSGVGSMIHLTVWLNGQRQYVGLITKEPQRHTTREIELRPGWNVLVFKTCHRTWQWQQALHLTELDGSAPQGLDYRASAPPK
ncbi:MAG: SGNH/GDSL hydrolase family protein [Prosthecobacter sp.]|uniref:SGNH/GDSL hydrolase family protein n=1 Tax=Prosthecobacter sp. TaxID=1965333 RepID=UPI003903B38A